MQLEENNSIDKIETPIFQKSIEIGYEFMYELTFYKDSVIIDKFRIENEDMPWIDGIEVSYKELIQFLD